MAVFTPKDTLKDRSVSAETASLRGSFSGDHTVNPMAAAPLVAQSVAMMAAATAVGLGVVNQFAGLFLGAMQGALEANRKNLPAIDQDSLGAADKLSAAPESSVTQLRVVVDNGAAAPEQPVPQRTAVALAPRKPVSKASKPRSAAKTQDDLKRISGIGPKLEKILNDKGFKRFADLARLSPEQVAALDAELGLGGRVTRDHWVEQSKAFAKERV